MKAPDGGRVDLFPKLFQHFLRDLCNHIGRDCGLFFAAVASASAGVAAGLAFLCVGAEIRGVASLHAELSPDLVEILHLLGVNSLGPPRSLDW